VWGGGVLFQLNDLKYLFRGGNDDNGVPAVAAPVRHGPVFAPV